jgi:hypothetical protein
MLGFSLSTLQKYLRYLPILAPLIDSIYTRIAPKGGPQERSIQDTPVDLSKLEMAIKHLVVLKVELRGIQETRREMDAVMEHVYALREILENAKKPVCQVLPLSFMSSSPRCSDSTFHPRP